MKRKREVKKRGWNVWALIRGHWMIASAYPLKLYRAPKFEATQRAVEYETRDEWEVQVLPSGQRPKKVKP